MKPKGFKMKYFWLNKCPTEKNVPTIFHVDEVCLNENELKNESILKFNFSKWDIKSSYRGWNPIHKVVEMKYFKEKDCKGQILRNLIIRPKTCVEDGFGAYFYVFDKN